MKNGPFSVNLEINIKPNNFIVGRLNQKAGPRPFSTRRSGSFKAPHATIGLERNMLAPPLKIGLGKT